MAFTEAPPRLPPTDQPLVDPRTGLMTSAWRNYFTALLAYLSKMAAAIP
jgi:hypothetical protein